jgi:hypothetical protein
MATNTAVRRVTLKDGPLAGRTFDVPRADTELAHHAAPGGRYRLTAKQGTWKADKPTSSESGD